MEQFVADDPVLQASCLLLSWCVCLCVCVCVSQSPAKDLSIFNEKQTFAFMWKRVRVKVSLLFLKCVRTSYLHHWMLE